MQSQEEKVVPKEGNGRAEGNLMLAPRDGLTSLSIGKTGQSCVSVRAYDLLYLSWGDTADISLLLVPFSALRRFLVYSIRHFAL